MGRLDKAPLSNGSDYHEPPGLSRRCGHGGDEPRRSSSSGNYSWLICLPLLACGCTNQDVEIVGRLGGKLRQKAEALLAAGNISWPGWQGGSAGAEPSLEARVAARLKWDMLLADQPIAVHAAGSVIELRGHVKTHDLRHRAVDLAQMTQGVELVKDEMEVPQ